MAEKDPRITCPACGKKAFRSYCPASFLRGDKRWIMECGDCGLSLLWPLPNGREIKAFYNQGYFDFNRNSEEGKGYFYSLLLRRTKEKGRFLDVGCATGFFLSGIKKNCAWDLYGQETGKEAAAFVRKNLGIQVKDVPLEKTRYPGNYFDFIHMNNVLEHVLDPEAVLREAGRILKPGGCLYLAVPNGKVDRQGYWNYHRGLGKRGASQDGHTYFFSPRSLALLAQKGGLRIEKKYGAGFKRSLRALGYWPKKRDWTQAYQGREPGRRKVEQAVTEGRSHSRFYYLFKHGKERLTRLPGFPSFSYDFNIYLTK